MKPIDYLRGVMLRDRKPTAPPPVAPRPLPILDWTNPVHITGACIHDVIYNECTCPDKDSRLAH